MQDRLQGLDGQPFDVVVIGGGMAGAGIARDAAIRGHRTLLLERKDFAFGTTSRSSKLIHGGLRYLELFDFGLVRESLRERERLQRLAPHLVRPLPFIVPVYRGAKRGLVTVRVGMKLYDLLTPEKRTEPYRTMSREETQRREPHLEPRDLLGAGFYFDDLLLLPERLCLENILSARRWGALVFNYAEVTAIQSREPRAASREPRAPARRASGERREWEIEIRDGLGGGVARVKARVVVNAAGPCVDRVRRLAGVDQGRRCLRTTKGIHLLLPRITDHAVYIAAKRDERMFFVIPWRGFSLVGTTDIQETQRVFPTARVREDEIAYTYAGVRPLAFEEGRAASAVSREHKVIPEGETGTFLSITGTKLTCYRSLAEEAVDRVGRVLGRPVSCRTHRLALDGSDGDGTVEVRLWADVADASRRSGLDPEQIQNLLAIYGRRSPAVLEIAARAPELRERLCKQNPDIRGQLLYALEHELTETLSDFLLRRTGIGTSACMGLDCCRQIAAWMGEIRGWDARRVDGEIEAFLDEIALGQRFREGLRGPHREETADERK
ncbi:MAG: glycerol-3-phosphate dehydrogenase/oxidase [candidate division NC10 bacterium]|nr:glycerol-3-phosphate dehydrogenase/oxidase [candidate division NC10 bacterium]